MQFVKKLLALFQKKTSGLSPTPSQSEINNTIQDNSPPVKHSLFKTLYYNIIKPHFFTIILTVVVSVLISVILWDEIVERILLSPSVSLKSVGIGIACVAILGVIMWRKPAWYRKVIAHLPIVHAHAKNHYATVNARTTEWTSRFKQANHRERWKMIKIPLIILASVILLVRYGNLFFPPSVATSFPGESAKETPLNSSIEIIFDRPVIHSTVENAFRITPSVKGSFHWEGDQKMVFNPEKNLERGAEYTVHFDGVYFSRMLIPRIMHKPIVFETIGNPKIVIATPKHEAPENLTPITVIFDRQMVPFTTATNSAVQKPAFIISPEIKGTGKWMGTTVYQFRPGEDYKKATTYSVTVDQTLKSQDGGVLSGDNSWSFSSVRPTIERTVPVERYEYASPTASVAAFFNQPMNSSSMSKAFQVFDKNNKSIPGRVVIVGNGVGFYPTQPFARETTYRAVVAKGAQSIQGPNGMEFDYEWSFTIAGAPQVIQTTPKNNEQKVTEDHTITISFKTPMDEDSLENNVTIDPAPEFKPSLYFSSYEKKHVLSIGTYMGRSQQYTVKIGANARDQYGTALGKEYALTFQTDAYKPSVSVYPNETYFASFNQHETPRIVAQTVNTRKVTYTLYKLKRDEFLDLYRKRYEGVCQEQLCRNWQNYNPSKLEKVKSWSESYEADFNTPVHVVTKVTNSSKGQLPSGMYYLDVRIPEGPHDNMVMIVSKSALTVKKSPGQIFAWAVDQRSTDTVSDMKMELVNVYGKVISSGTTNKDGVFMKDADLSDHNTVILFGQRGDDAVVAAGGWSEGINRYNFGLPSYYNYSESSDYNSEQDYKIYVTLDRPIFRPGHKVYFKGVIRKDNDGAYESIGVDQKVNVKVSDQQNRQIYQKQHTVTSYGSFSGDLVLGTDISVGRYQIAVSYDGKEFTQGFQVEEYRKQDFSVTAKPAKKSYIDGERGTITIGSSYYFGAPVSDAPAQWSLYSYDYTFQWDKDWRFEFGDPDSYWGRYWEYGSQSYSGNVITEGKGITNAQGEVEVTVPLNISTNSVSQLMRVDAVVTDINNQSLADSQEFIVHKAGILAGLHPTRYSNRSGRPASVEVVTINPSGSELANIPVQVEFYKRTWESIREQDPDSGQFFYRSVPSDSSVHSATVTTDSIGRATASFTPEQGGTYKVLARVTDQNGKTHTSGSFMWVSGMGFVAERTNNDRITLITDKREYNVNESLSVFVATPFASSSAKTLLTAERGSVISYKVANVDEINSTIDLPVESRYTPNIFLGAMLIKPGTGVKNPSEFKIGYTEVKVTDKKLKLDVKITTDKRRYKPGETMKAKVQTRNLLNEPVSTELAVGLVDKAVWDLASTELTDIYKIFYQPRNLEIDTSQLLTISLDRVYANINLGSKGGSGGGCFTGDTAILMKGGVYKHIKDVTSGDIVLTRESDSSPKLVEARVIKKFHHVVDRYLIINGTLEVTPEHKMFVNGVWKTASEIQIGDQLLNKGNKHVKVHSVEYIAQGKFNVYNLHIDKYHTFIAEDIYVHNDKGGFETSRRNFPDTAYWNPHIKTNNNGVAEIAIKLPDSLTTWRLSAVANTDGASFGSQVDEIIVSRDVLIRPFTPRFLSVGDQAELGAIVVNTSGQDQTLNVTIQAQGLSISDQKTKQVSIAEGGQAKVTWKSTTLPGTQAKIGFSISDTSQVTRDSMELTLPVKTHSTPETVAVSGQAKDTAEEKIVLPKDVIRNQGQASIQLSPSLGSAGLSGYSYLAEYPYHCSEQIVSRFVPALYIKRIMKNNPKLSVGKYDQKSLDRIINDGVQRLKNQQHTDGGWGWWMEYQSDPFITAYVYSSLYEAKKDGYAVDEKILQKTEDYLRRNLKEGASKVSLNEQAFILYSLRHNTRGLSGYGQNLFERRYELSLESRAYLSMALEKMSGMGSLAKRQHNELLSLVKKTATTAHWEESKKQYSFMGSNTTTTATVLESMVVFNRNNPLIAETVRYLMSIRTDYHWATTRDTASAIKSLSDQILKTTEGVDSKAFKVELNGKHIARGQFEKGDLVRMAEHVIDISKFQFGNTNTLRISGSGGGSLYYNINMKYFLPFDEIEPLDQGIVVDRELVNSKGEELSKDTIAEGTEAWIRLTIAIPEDRHYLIVEDLLPAGFEAVNESLKNVSTLTAQRPPSGNQEANSSWYYFSHKEYRDDRVALFADYLPPGIYEVTYRVRATTPGRYHYPPAQAYQMYIPDVSGHSDGGWLEVTARP